MGAMKRDLEEGGSVGKYLETWEFFKKTLPAGLYFALAVENTRYSDGTIVSAWKLYRGDTGWTEALTADMLTAMHDSPKVDAPETIGSVCVG